MRLLTAAALILLYSKQTTSFSPSFLEHAALNRINRPTSLMFLTSEEDTAADQKVPSKRSQRKAAERAKKENAKDSRCVMGDTHRDVML
jgi:hypothetical protein